MGNVSPHSEPNPAANPAVDGAGAPPVLTETRGNRPQSPFASRHTRAAIGIVIGAVVFFWCFAGLIFTQKKKQTTAYPVFRNNTELLLAAGASGASRKLPEISDWHTNLASARIAFGHEQIARMIKDRPRMADWVSEQDAIYRFCVRGFAGAAIGEPILWDNTLPEDQGRHAEHLWPYRGKRGFIRVRNNEGAGPLKGSPLSCEEMWACVVFELENIRGWKADAKLYQMALSGQLTRDEWIRESSRLEHSALRRAATDCNLLWRPIARSKHLQITPGFWGLDTPATYDEWIALYTDPNGYPWNAFGRYYDQQVIPYLRSIGLQPKQRN